MTTATMRQLGLCVWALLGAASVAAGAPPRDARLVEAAAAQDIAEVRALLRARVDVNTRRADGATALLWAAHWNNLEMVNVLLTAGADPNAAEDHGVTPLAMACENTNVSIVKRLLAAGADANAAQSNGLTPLIIASHTGSVPLVEALLETGANPNAVTTQTHATALMWAVAAGHREIVRLLLQHHADPHVSTAKGLTPLIMAASNGDIETAKLLMAAGVGVNEMGTDGIHVLPFAIASGEGEFALFLLEQGADPNASMGGVHALHAAAGSVSMWLDDWSRSHGVRLRGLTLQQRIPLVKALLERGADPNARITASAMFMNFLAYPRKGAFDPFACGTGDLYGATPLWVAALAANGNLGPIGSGDAGSSAGPATIEVLRILLAAGADQHLTTNDGTTPFMIAAGLGRATFTPGLPRAHRSESAENAVKLLLEHGADINAVNEAEFTALHGAAFRGLNEVVQLLVERGANIDARDFRGRTPYRLAEGSKQSFQFQAWPETAKLLQRLGANVRLGIPGTVQERLRDVVAAGAAR